MRIVPRLKWYEWIGWLVNALMIAGGVTFILINILEAEMRAAMIGFLFSLLLVGLWTWILLFFGKEKKKKSAPELETPPRRGDDGI